MIVGSVPFSNHGLPFATCISHDFPLVFSRLEAIGPIRISGWWLTYPSEKWWTSSVGMMFHSQYIWKVIIIIHSMVPVTTNQSKIGFLMVDPHCTSPLLPKWLVLPNHQFWYIPWFNGWVFLPFFEGNGYQDFPQTDFHLERGDTLAMLFFIAAAWSIWWSKFLD